MSVEHIETWHKRPYGWRADGVIETEGHNIPVTIREPDGWSEELDMTYVMANGWTAGKNSMRVPAIEATRFRRRSVTLEYTNTGSSEALEQNVADVVATIDAQPGERRAAIGLSMGGTVVTKALDKIDKPLEIATLVAPGKYILPEYFSSFRIFRQFAEESLEITEIGRNPLMAVYIGATSAANCIRRPGAVRSELRELLTGTVHEDLRRAKELPNAPFIRFVSPQNDRLLPARAQEDSIKDLPFDDVMKCEGGHGRLAYDYSLSRQIYRADAEVLKASRSQLPQAA